MATKEQVIALHRKHPDWTTGMIADELECSTAYVSTTARRQGLKVPPTPSRGRQCGIYLRIKRSLLKQFEAAAFEYAVPAEELARHLIETIINDDLFEAVIDKEPIAPNGFEQVGIPLNRALGKIAKGKLLDGEAE